MGQTHLRGGNKPQSWQPSAAEHHGSFFDMLGATVSCQYDGHGDSVTSLNRENECTLFPAPIRFHNHISKDAILQMKKEAKDMKGDLRGVMIVRDPLEMVASSYCYHHRGAEPHNPMQKGIPEMGPEERQWRDRDAAWVL